MTQIAYVIDALSILYRNEIAARIAEATTVLEHVKSVADKRTNTGSRSACFDAHVADGLVEPLIIPWCTYRGVSFYVTKQEQELIDGHSDDSSYCWNALGERIIACKLSIARAIEQDALVGTGVDSHSNPTLIGLFGGALSVGDQYGGVNAHVYPAWRPQLITNGGKARNLSPDLMNLMDASIFDASGEQFDHIVTTASIARRYMAYWALSSADSPLKIYWKGQLVQRAVCAPSGQMAFVKRRALWMKWLATGVAPEHAKYIASICGSDVQDPWSWFGSLPSTYMPTISAGVEAVGNDMSKVSLRCTCAFAVTQRNVCGLIRDVAEEDVK